MPEISPLITGPVLALLFLLLALLPGASSFVIGSPVFFIVTFQFKFPQIAKWFLITFAAGALAGKVLFHWYPQSWVLPEVMGILFLSLTPAFIQKSHDRVKTQFDSEFQERESQFLSFRNQADEVKKKNNQIEKQLRQIEHLYDVIKEAGSTLNVQEMIELAKDFTERMFELPHFIIAVLSNDGKKYEVKIVSGCDEVFLKSFELDIESNQIGAVLAREKKPVWMPTMEQNQRFAKWGHLPIRSFVFMPFLVQDRVIGFICSYSLKESLLDQEKFMNFQIFCNQISIGLQKSLLYEKVQKLSITDGLTKLYSHRYFKQRLEEEMILANRYSSPLSLLILDIDHFKHYNDSYGHVAGDHVLMDVAKILRDQSDVAHLAARYGGEEMVLIASETTKEQVIELAEKIRKSVENYSFAIGKETTRVTVSIGVATYPEDAQTSLDLIGKSDQALYAAKGRGRNCVVAYPI
jgi:diguanylate cyclase (GGDEF)-like protein